MDPWLKHPWLLRIGALAVAALAVLMLNLRAPQSVAAVEAIVGDAFWRLGAGSQPERRLVVVDIDEASLREFGAWPWPRSVSARLVEKLTAAGSLVQGYDITFSDPRDGDDALRAAWSASNPVVAQLFSLDPVVAPEAGVVAGALAAPGCPAFAPAAFGQYGTAPALLEAHPAVGHINARVEADGVIRKVPALVCSGGKAYPSLALTMLWRTAQADGRQPAQRVDQAPAPDWQWHSSRDQGALFGWFAPEAWLTSRSLPGLVVPLDAEGNLRVPYHLSRKAFVSVPAADVLHGRVDPNLLKGAVVLVGATAFGAGDTVATPHGSVASGLEVHVQSFIGLLDHRVPYTPRAWPVIQVLGVLALTGLLLAVGLRRRGVPAKRLPLSGLVLAAACVLGAGAALVDGALWLPWLSLALYAVVASLMLATVEHALARAQRERLSAHLGAYLPAPVAQRLMRTDPSGSLQVDQRDVSVLVADIRNFSAFAAHRPPAETAALLHSFCCIAVDVVEQHGGVVENVVGDSVLAVWNADPYCEDHPARALAAARELVRSTRSLFASSTPITEHGPVQPLALGVGLESGTAIVGSFGPERRRAHAALGEPVSVANRIQQMTADLSMPILLGPQMAALLPGQGLEPQGEYLLEGLSRHYPLYAPAGWAELVSVDPKWAESVVAAPDRAVDNVEWTRWSNLTKTGPSAAGASPAARPGQLRDA